MKGIWCLSFRASYVVWLQRRHSSGERFWGGLTHIEEAAWVETGEGETQPSSSWCFRKECSKTGGDVRSSRRGWRGGRRRCEASRAREGSQGRVQSCPPACACWPWHWGGQCRQKRRGVCEGGAVQRRGGILGVLALPAADHHQHMAGNIGGFGGVHCDIAHTLRHSQTMPNLGLLFCMQTACECPSSSSLRYALS